jgi:mannose/cellobiose epimerase-like protein (N-acyl-D-glucosamine 2-epimerase family)
MHLLEACLAWAEIGRSRADWVRRLVNLALSRFIRKDSGVLGDSYLANWEPTLGAAGHAIEPGHQFEWAWLLLRCEGLHPGPLRSTAAVERWMIRSSAPASTFYHIVGAIDALGSMRVNAQ